MRVIALMMVLVGMTSEAWADPGFSLDPAQSRDGQIINLRVDDPSSCTPFGAPTVVRNGNTVTASFLVDDAQVAGPCPGGREAPRLHALGTFTTGNYQVQVEYCGALPPPDTCSVAATMSLSSFGLSGTRFTVPTLSGAAVILLMFAVMAIGAISPRRP